MQLIYVCRCGREIDQTALGEMSSNGRFIVVRHCLAVKVICLSLGKFFIGCRLDDNMKNHVVLRETI